MVKKAHLVTGKGGVGKSLFSAALAYGLSLENKPILLTELNEVSFYRDFLPLAEINYKPTTYKKNFDVAQWAPDECLKEYALHLLKIESLYKLFLENPVTKSLIQIAPGLHELALLGKLTSSPRRHGPPMPYQEIVVDSFSSGHFLALLRSPIALNEAIPFGPMGEQTKNISAYMQNPEFTEIHILCLPEELPVTETIELESKIKNEFGLQPKVYLNKVLNLTETEIAILPTHAQFSLKTMLQQQNEAREKLKMAGIKVTEIPFIASSEINTLLKKVSASLQGPQA